MADFAYNKDYSSEELKELIEKELSFVIEAASLVEPLKSAVKHAVFPPGKLIRPLLCVTLCQDLGGDIHRLLRAAVSLELLHASSLVHDDLPAMDDDDIRRGKPSCHKAFGEATAILVGDYLVGLAHQVLCQADYPAVLQQMFVSELSNTYMSLCNGQQLDMLDDRSVSLDTVHQLKTGALFGAAFKFGAIASGCSQRQIDTCKELGLWVGLSFQIIDDYLDIIGEEKGRPAGSDQKNNKVTFLDRKHEIHSEIEDVRERIETCLDQLYQLCSNEGRIDDNFVNLRPIINSVFDKVIS
ncbi:MAG: polyprenyl synthetase family protein [Deltaproteobacteria bacterium]|nr:polyprenyl synthetase family protein [Deltaproteobacteria bacterium]